MKLVARSRAITVEALVTDAALAPHSVVAPRYGDWVWLVPGMTVSIDVDPAKLDHVARDECDEIYRQAGIAL
jgi:hypothetical protein